MGREKMRRNAAWPVAGLTVAAGILAAFGAPFSATASAATLRVVYDFSSNDYELFHPEYAGVTLSPDGKSLWFVNEVAWASITLDGTVRLHGRMPYAGGISFGSLTFDTSGNAWGIAEGGLSSGADGSIFKISPAGILHNVKSLTDSNGHPQTGLAYYNGAVYGQSWVYGDGPANLFKMSTSSGQLSNVASTNFAGVDHGKPVITSAGVLYGADGARVYSQGNYIGSYTLLRYDTKTGESQSLGFVAVPLPNVHSVMVYGAATPAVDQFGNAYVAALRSQTVIPYSDVLLAVSPAGTTTKVHFFPNVNNDYNTFSGLVFDPVHKHIYGGYYEINGPDLPKSNLGKLFCYDPATNNYATIFQFNGYSGSMPVGDFAVDASGTHLYGATWAGGKLFDGTFNSGAGELFELSLGKTPPC